MTNFEKKVLNKKGVYVIAEIGANHNGDINLAKKIIDEAKKSGADCVKFQSWQPESIASKKEFDDNINYTDSKKKHFGSLREMVDKYYLSFDEHRVLKDYCDEINIDFSSSPFTFEEVDLLKSLDVPFLKVASMDIVHFDLLKYIAKTGLPVILSTGMASLSEIDIAIKTLEDAGAKEIIVLHCISIYPPKNQDIRLKNIEMLSNTFNLPVGFSDHSIGSSIPLASVALGSVIIEKHFTLDKDLPGWDHAISANPEELAAICSGAKNIFESLGGSKRIVSEAEIEKKQKFRRSLVYKSDFPKNHVITKDDLTGKRPGSGIPIENKDFYIGKKITENVLKDQLLKNIDYEY